MKLMGLSNRDEDNVQFFDLISGIYEFFLSKIDQFALVHLRTTVNFSFYLFEEKESICSN